jgi:hypothetical protein
MISRREVVTAGVLGSLTSGTANAETMQGAEEAAVLRAGFKALEDQLKDLKNALEHATHGNSMNFGGVGSVKTKIQEYAKTSGKFPEYCDVGLGIFYDIYDWHVRNQQQINISRIADQRLAIQFMFTQLVLRWENVETFVGTPYSL